MLVDFEEGVALRKHFKQAPIKRDATRVNEATWRRLSIILTANFTVRRAQGSLSLSCCYSSQHISISSFPFLRSFVSGDIRSLCRMVTVMIKKPHRGPWWYVIVNGRVCDGVLRVLLDWDSLVLSRSCTSGMYSVFTYNISHSIFCFIDGYGVCHQPSVLTFMLTYLFRNKWVLNNTDVPLFFLCCQLVIAVILFLVAHTLGLLKLPLEFDLQVCKGLIPMVGLNVIGLRYAHITFLNSYL